MPRPRSIDLEDYDFREVPGGTSEYAFLGDSPTKFDDRAILAREEAEIEYEFEPSADPFELLPGEDDAWGSSILTLDDIEDAQRRGIPLGQVDLYGPGPRGLDGWLDSAWKKATKAVSQTVKKWGSEISKAAKDLVDPVNIPGTREWLDNNARKGTDKALGPVWAQMSQGTDTEASMLELHRRMADYIASAIKGKMPTFQIAPPGQAVSASARGMSGLGWLTAVTTAFKLGQGMFDANTAKDVESFVKKLDLPGIQTKATSALQAFMAGGGLPPTPGVKPPKEYTDAFVQKVIKGYTGPRAKGDDKKRPKGGWNLQYIKTLGQDLADMTPGIIEAHKAMRMALNAYQKTTMPAVVRAIGRLATKLLDKGVISVPEVPKAIRILHKHKQGYVLTPDEQAFIKKIEPFFASTGKKIATGVGTAAAVTALLTLV